MIVYDIIYHIHLEYPMFAFSESKLTIIIVILHFVDNLISPTI